MTEVPVFITGLAARSAATAGAGDEYVAGFVVGMTSTHDALEASQRGDVLEEPA